MKRASWGVLAPVLVAAMVGGPGPAGAAPMAASPRPLPRPEAGVPASAQSAVPAPEMPVAMTPAQAARRPLPRPETITASVAPTPDPGQSQPDPADPAPSPPGGVTPGGVAMTMLTPPGIRPLAKPAQPMATRPNATPDEAPPPAKGSGKAPSKAAGKNLLCGVSGLVGQPIAPIRGEMRGCGLEEGVRITAVSGVRLSQPMTVDCPTAVAFKKWIDRGIVPAVGSKGGGLARLEVGPGYVCRPRNNQRGAKVSEHGRGKAIDLMGIVLKNGQSIDVAGGWGRNARMFRNIHASACGPFGTVLGPKADRYHQDHIHVDTARYRSGNYCR